MRLMVNVPLDVIPLVAGNTATLILVACPVADIGEDPPGVCDDPALRTLGSFFDSFRVYRHNIVFLVYNEVHLHLCLVLVVLGTSRSHHFDAVTKAD